MLLRIIRPITGLMAAWGGKLTLRASFKKQDGNKGQIQVTRMCVLKFPHHNKSLTGLYKRRSPRLTLNRIQAEVSYKIFYCSVIIDILPGDKDLLRNVG